MKIDRIELGLLRLPLVHFFETSFGRIQNRTFVLMVDANAACEPPFEVGPDGTIPVPTAPGLGVEVVRERVERATERVLNLTKSSP